VKIDLFAWAITSLAEIHLCEDEGLHWPPILRSGHPYMLIPVFK